MPTLIVRRDLKAARKAFSDARRHGLPSPRLSEIRGKWRELPEEAEELFIDKLAEVLAEEYKKQERKGENEETNT